MEKPPKFVSLNGSALRLIGKRYYRDGGQWWVGYRFIEGKLMSVSIKMDLSLIHNQPLIEITEEEWRKSNGRYAPEKI